MTVAVRSFAKINLGLYIGAARADGYRGLRTVYQTIAPLSSPFVYQSY